MRQNAVALLWVLGCAGLAGSCGGDPADDAVRADSLGGDADEIPRADSAQSDADAPLVMPDYPEPMRGHLVTRSAGADEIAGEWPARAGMCEETRTVQLVASGEGVGAILLFYLAPGADHVATYPAVPVDSTVPEPPAIRVGVQLLRSRMGDSFQAFGGTVEVTELDRRASGRLRLHLVNTDTRDTVLYAGVFSDVRLRSWSPLECGALDESEEVADTLADSTAADSLD
jgi:hypothetical protein